MGYIEGTNIGFRPENGPPLGVKFVVNIMIYGEK
jgi:hypothetical protein